VVARIEAQDLLKRHSQLRDQLVIGDDCQDGKRQAFIQLLYARHHVFALSDSELGETELVEHQIDLVDGKPVQAPPADFHMHSEQNLRQSWRSY